MDVKALVVFAGCFVAVFVLLLGVVFVGWRWMLPAPAPGRVEVLMPGPALQPSRSNPETDKVALARMRADAKEEFTRRGWVNAAGDARVPPAIAERVAAESRGESP